MKQRFLTAATRSGLGLLLLLNSAIAYCGEEALANWAATHAFQVTTVDPASNDSDLLRLESAIGTARVVALGEPMHGAHEPPAFRNRLFRFLVEQMGFTAIALASTLAGVGLPLMFLDVRMARQNEEAHTWLAARRSVNANVSSQTLITLSSAVDGFVFVNTLTPATIPSAEAP